MSDAVMPQTPEPRRRRSRRVIALVSVLGPGLIAANAGNDAGGIATYASAGAQFGYRTLFVMVVLTVAYAVVQEMAARLGVFSGEGLVSLFREQLPLRLGAFVILCLLVANFGLVVSEFAGIGAALELFGVSRYLSIPIGAIAVWAIVVFGSYRYAERLFLLFTLPFLAYPIAAFLGHPKWGEVASNTFVPHVLASKGFLFLTVALIGTTITPYIQLYEAAAMVDRGMGPSDYPRARIDAVGGAIFSDLISVFIIIATAAAIGDSGALSSAKQAATALRPVAGAGAEALFAVGLLGASALAAAIVPLATAHSLAEALGVERSQSKRFSEAPFFMGMFTAQIVVGSAIALLPGNLISLLINLAVLNGLIAPVVLGSILVLANRRSLLGDAANGPRFRVVATVCVGFASILAAIVFVQTVLGWLGLGR